MPTKITDPTRLAEIAARNERLGFGTTKRVDDTVTYTSTQKPKDNTFSFTQKVDTTNSDTTGSDTPEAPLSETYKGFLPTDNSDYEAAQKAYRDSLNYTPLSEEEIRAKTRERMQREIDATNKVYAEKLRQEAIAGRGRLGQSRAIQAASGQLGSTFGQAQKNVVSMENQALEEAINNQRLAEEIRILTEGRKDTVEEAEKQYLAKQTSAKNILDYYAGQVTEKANRLKSTVSNMINSGETIDEATFTEIAKALGVSPLEVKALYNATKIEKENKYETLNAGQTLYDTTTGKAIYTAPEQADTISEDERYKVVDGQLFDVVDKKFIEVPQDTVAGGILSTLPVTIQGKILSIAESFGTKDVVKRFNSLTEAVNAVNGISKTSTNPADHQAIVYQFAKALDPDSAVREGEYETIKKYAQGLLERYGKEISNAINGTGFLSQDAINNIQKTMNGLYTNRKPVYDNLYNSTAAVIDNVAGVPVSDQILIDYTNGFTDTTQTSTDETYNLMKSEAGGVDPTKQEYEKYVGQSIDDKTWAQISGSFNTPQSTGKKGSTDVTGIKDGTRVSTLMGNGVATSIVAGSKFWKPGMDFVIDGGKGAPVPVPFGGEVVFAGKDGWFGNSVKVKLDNGEIIRLSHLNDIKVKKGDKLSSGAIVGGQGNTGKTYGKTGIHVDVTMYKPDGKPYTSQEVASFLNTQIA